MKWRLVPAEPSHDMVATSTNVRPLAYLPLNKAIEDRKALITAAINAAPDPARDGVLREDIARRIWDKTCCESDDCRWGARENCTCQDFALDAADAVLDLVTR